MDPNSKIMLMQELARLRRVVHETCRSSRERSMMVQKIDECALWLGSIKVAKHHKDNVDTTQADFYPLPASPP
jgi:hypothetical protein